MWQWWVGRLLEKRGIAYAAAPRRAVGISAPDGDLVVSPTEGPVLDAARFCLDAVRRFERDVILCRKHPSKSTLGDGYGAFRPQMVHGHVPSILAFACLVEGITEGM